MRKFFKLLKTNKKKAFVIAFSFILNTLSTLGLLYSIYLLNGIENLMRLMVGIILIIILLLFYISYRKSIKKEKSKYILYIPITIIYSCILFLGSYYIIKTYNIIDSITSNSTTYSSSIVTLSENKANKISQIKSGKIGRIADDASIDGYQIPKDIVKKEKLDNKILDYESYISLIKALYSGEVEYIFLPTNYTVMFQNMDEAEINDLNTKTKIIYTKEKKVKKNILSKKTNLKKPFTILIMGVDSENEEIANSSFNGDSLILITFNPTTLNTTMLSIPRDSYVPIMCFAGHKKNKITHAAWYGQDCMIDTIENFTGIDIDYYMKINFKGVVKLVDTLGGVDMDVPYAFCEQNSNRQWGNNTIYVEKGQQVLNGEQALAFSRNRHTWPAFCGKKYSNYTSNDFIRGQNQQKVIRALLNKLKTVRSLDTVYNLLDTISNSMETNMTTNEILSLYNIGKDIIVKSNGGNVEDLLGIQRLYLSGADAYIYDAGSGLNLYNYVLADKSLEQVIEAMKVNLNLKEPQIIKDFSFNIDKPYEETVIGKGTYAVNTSKETSKIMPDFTGDTEAQARSYCNKYKINVTFKYTSSGSGTNGTVVDQNYKKGYDLSKVNGITLTVLKKDDNSTTNTKKESINEENTTKEILMPNFIGDTEELAEKYCNNNNILFEIGAVTNSTNFKCTSDTNEKIISQDYSVGTNITDKKIHLYKCDFKEEEEIVQCDNGLDENNNECVSDTE